MNETSKANWKKSKMPTENSHCHGDEEEGSMNFRYQPLAFLQCSCQLPSPTPNSAHLRTLFCRLRLAVCLKSVYQLNWVIRVLASIRITSPNPDPCHHHQFKLSDHQCCNYFNSQIWAIIWEAHTTGLPDLYSFWCVKFYKEYASHCFNHSCVSLSIFCFKKKMISQARHKTNTHYACARSGFL